MTSARRRFSTGERVKRFPIEPMHRPLAERLGLKRSIEAERRLIPVEHIPFEARVSTLYGELGERREERLADALATTLGQHEEVFEPEPMAACPRGVGDEVEREAYASLALQCDVGVHACAFFPDRETSKFFPDRETSKFFPDRDTSKFFPDRDTSKFFPDRETSKFFPDRETSKFFPDRETSKFSKERTAQIGFGRHHAVTRTLVLGQCTDQRVDVWDVARTCRANDE